MRVASHRRGMWLVLTVAFALGSAPACGLGLVGTGAAGASSDDGGAEDITDAALEGSSADGSHVIADASTEATITAEGSTGLDADVDAGLDAGCLAAAPGMVSWWRGEGDLTDALLLNPGAAGTQNGASGMAYAAGEVGTAFDLGAKSYVQIANAPDLQITTQLTMEAWVWSSGFGGRIVDKITAGGSDGYMLDTYQSKLRLIIGLTAISSPATLPTSTWVHVAGTWDGATARVYVGGALVASTAAPSLPNNTLAVRIGADNTGASHLAGKVDEVAIYNRALSATELAAIVAAGASGRCKP